MALKWLHERNLVILLLASVSGGCGELGEVPPDGMRQGLPSDPVAATLQAGPARAVPGFERCQPVSGVADEAGSFYLAVTCPAPPGMAVAPVGAPSPAPGLPQGGSPGGQPTVMVVPGSFGSSIEGGLIMRAGTSARLAAGAAGQVYFIDGGFQTALQLETLFTRDGGRSWYRIASPDPDSHFVQGRVAADGDRVLFGAVELGRGPPDLQISFPIRVWGPPSREGAPVPSNQLAGAGEDLDLALHLPRRTTMVWAARRAAPGELALFTSQDGDATFSERRLSIATELGAMTFGHEELFLVSPDGRIEIAPLTRAGSNELIVAPWPAAEEIRSHLIDSAGHLWTLSSSPGGILSARRLGRPGTTWSEGLALGVSDGSAQAIAMPDGSLLVAFSRQGHLYLQPVAAP